MIPTYLNKLHNFLSLVADIIFINGNVFVITSEVKLKFVTVKNIHFALRDVFIYKNIDT